MKRKAIDRLEAAKLVIFNVISLTLVTIAGLGMVAFEVISIWHLLRRYAGLP
jgi:hypothetical protein